MTLLTRTPFDHPRRRAERLVWLVLAAAALLLVALWSPADRPGPILCTLRLAVALPCPFCGVTRGVSLCLHGRPAEASAHNPLAVPVTLLAAALMARWAYEYLSNTHLRLRLPRGAWAILIIVVLAAWVYVLCYRREDDFASSWVGQLLE